jgi:CubicO group peptidase (beta-lactamase class C family)
VRVHVTLLIPAALCVGWLAACGPGEKRDTIDTPRVEGDLAHRLDRFLAQEADSGWDGTVLVARDGQVILHRGYGSWNHAGVESVTTVTPFWIASISKQFAAVASLKLIEAGKLSLADSLPKFFRNVPPDKQGIRLEQLLDHTAGLARKYAADGIEDRDRAVSAILAVPLDRKPGQEFGYSNDAYNLVAAIVEIASGTPYEQYLSDHLLRPAGLKHTGFWGPHEHPEVAPIRGQFADSANVRPNWGFRGATGMFSTAGDLYRWNEALHAGKIISRSRLDALLAPHTRSRKGFGVGYGWFSSRTSFGTPKIWTRGHEDFGHGAVLATYPKERTVIVVTSDAGDKDALPVSHRLSEQLEALIFATP